MDRILLSAGKGISSLISLSQNRIQWESPPVPGTGTGYICTDKDSVFWTTLSNGQGKLLASHMNDGTIQWDHTFPCSFVSTPQLRNDALFFGFNNDDRGEIVRFFPALKAPVWRCSFSEELTGNLILSGNRLFARTRAYLLGLIVRDKAIPGKRKVSRSKRRFCSANSQFHIPNSG